MNQEEREALTHQTTQRKIACLHQTTNREETIRSLLTTYGREMYAAGNRNAEEWIRRMLVSLPIPIVITRTIPEGEGGKEPVFAYHWKTQDVEGDGVTFAYCLEQAPLAVLKQQEQQP
jgi:hypothetical protein